MLLLKEVFHGFQKVLYYNYNYYYFSYDGEVAMIMLSNGILEMLVPVQGFSDVLLPLAV